MNEVDEMLPLTPAVFHILLALANGAKHGYAIMQEVDLNTNGQLQMGPGTLYGSIKRMLKADLIEETDGTDDDPRRRYYRLTPLGQAVGRAEATRLANLVQVAQTKAEWGIVP